LNRIITTLKIASTKLTGEEFKPPLVSFRDRAPFLPDKKQVEENEGRGNNLMKLDKHVSIIEFLETVVDNLAPPINFLIISFNEHFDYLSPIKNN
jgi:hypothetical protein